MKISIFIINYNNAKFLKRSINSALNQTYKNKEIIVYDDCSKDGSQKIIRSFKNIKKIFNTRKLKSGSQSQIIGIKKCLDISTGQIICFMDSDDFFKKEKLNKVSLFFKNNPNINLASDKAIFVYGKKTFINDYRKINKARFFTWPKFSPQSCLLVKKNFLKKYFQYLSVKNFDDVWFDFRILIFSYMKCGKINLINNHLTYYQQASNSASSKFFKFSIQWWMRRFQAHNFFFFLNKKLNFYKKTFYFDYLITKLIYTLFK